ncbi:hypothetical protein ACOBR2_06560 [Telmatobacter bradus]|uniref:hypothetical protein n=1 Tax=Telmatobacter bradus TaxID=474953 RepID=UPI003B4300EC
MNFSENISGLRNDRKACHFWVDNELADVYQPIVGADAVWVYCRIARYAHGAWIVSPKRRGGDTRVGLREMAEWCSKSVDTVWRCLQVLTHVGLLRAEVGGRTAGRYALVDVKDLVVREGGEYCRELGSFQLPKARVEELCVSVRALRARLARKKGTETAAQSDSSEGLNFFAPEVKCDSSVAPSDTSVALGATPSIKQESKTAKTTTPPNPLVTEGELAVKSEDAVVPQEYEFTQEQLEHLEICQPAMRGEFERFYREENVRHRAEAQKVQEKPERSFADVTAARIWVMGECDYQEHRRGRGIARVIDAVLRDRVKRGEALGTVAERMVASVRKFTKNAHLMRFPCGPVKFFELGLWADERKWPWDYALLRR